MKLINIKWRVCRYWVVHRRLHIAHTCKDCDGLNLGGMECDFKLDVWSQDGSGQIYFGFRPTYPSTRMELSLTDRSLTYEKRLAVFEVVC